MNRHLWKFLILLWGIQFHSQFSLAQESPSSAPASGANRIESSAAIHDAGPNSFVVMTFNVGTTLGLRHDEGPSDGYTSAEAKISDRWYGNGLSWRAAIDAVRKTINVVDPDIVAFQEIFDCRECEQIPVEQRKGFVCEDWSPGDPNVAQLVLGAEYQIAYHPGKRSKCLAVHRRFGTLRGCEGDDCDDALDGYPIEGCGSGSRVARAFVERPNGQTLTVISLHGTSGLSRQDQQCRVQQVDRVFVDFGDGMPGVRGDQNLILGDFNTDPGRAFAMDASATRWNHFIGDGKPFHFVSEVGANAPRAYRGFADIDHVVTDQFQGTSRYLGLGPQSLPVWDGVYFDHVPVVCTLTAQENNNDPPAIKAVGPEAYDAIVRFYDYDTTIPLQRRVVERTDNEASIREKFVIRGVRGFMVPGYLEVPKDHPSPVPLVMLLHGWSGSKQSWWQDGGYLSGGNLRRALLNAGYAVLAIDAPTHGDRIAENDYAQVNDLSDDGRPNHRNYFTVNEIVSQGTLDCRRALDFVESRADIDPKRIGMIGYSMGGWQTFLLTAVEPRIRASVACVVPSLAGQSTPIAPKDYARGIGERPFLMLMGRTDAMCHPQHARQILDLIPSDKKDLIFFDAGHKLPSDYVNDALAWFNTHLK